MKYNCIVEERTLTAYKQQSPILSYQALYPAPESNRHGFPQVFETSASTNSASWACYLSDICLEAGCKCI